MPNNELILFIFYSNPDQYPPVVNSTRLLARAGYRVSFLCRDTEQDWRVNYPVDVQIKRLKVVGGGSWREYLRFVWQVLTKAEKPACVFVGHDMHGLLPARLLAWRYRRPLIYHCHDFSDQPDALAFGGRIVKLFEQRFARTADMVIVPDKDRAAVMVEALHLTRPPLIVANAPLLKSRQASSALAKAVAVQGKVFERILFRQGRIGTGHAIEATIRSLPYWQNRAWGFVIMGYGEAAYLEYLVEVAQSLDVAEQFAILPPVGYDEVAAFTAGASVGHALYEPIHVNNVHIAMASNKLMEYLAAGLPVLVSDQSGLRALVDQYACGLTANESSPASIAAAVNALLDDANLENGLGENGRRAFEEVFCYDRQYRPVLERIQALIEPR